MENLETQIGVILAGLRAHKGGAVREILIHGLLVYLINSQLILLLEGLRNAIIHWRASKQPAATASLSPARATRLRCTPGLRPRRSRRPHPILRHAQPAIRTARVAIAASLSPARCIPGLNVPRSTHAYFVPL
jgi:hypothetical protein